MFDSTDTESMTAAEIAARRRMLEVLSYFQAVEGKDWRFDHCSPIIGIREGYRIVGRYQLRVDDLRAGREFDDAVARDGRNLLMAGRCMSADQLALSSARVTTTCSMMG